MCGANPQQTDGVTPTRSCRAGCVLPRGMPEGSSWLLCDIAMQLRGASSWRDLSLQCKTPRHAPWDPFVLLIEQARGRTSLASPELTAVLKRPPHSTKKTWP